MADQIVLAAKDGSRRLFVAPDCRPVWSFPLFRGRNVNLVGSSELLRAEVPIFTRIDYAFKGEYDEDGFPVYTQQ